MARTTRRSSWATPKAEIEETRFRLKLCLALGVPSLGALGHLLSARDLDRWRAFFKIEPIGWEAFNIHQAAVRLPHYKPGTRLDQLLFKDGLSGSDPGDPKNLDQAPAKPPAGGTLTSEQLIAWTEAALQLGVPGITRGDPAPKQASDPDPGPQNPI